MQATPRRTALIRLLARIDQQMSKAESLAADQRLSPAERRYAEAQSRFHRKTGLRVEAMLAELGERK